MFNSNRRVGLLTSLMCAMMLAGPADAQQTQKAPAKPTGPTPVIASFRCPLGPDCSGTDGIAGDGLPGYTASLAGSSSVANSGDLYLELQPGLGRFMSLDFAHVIGTPPCAAARTCRKTFTTVFTDSVQPASVTNPVDAMDTELPNGLLSISVGQSVHARFKLNFADPSGRSLLWTIRFNPTMYPGSGYVTVTRASTTSWTIEASGSDVAELVAISTDRGKQVMTYEGYYSIPFMIWIKQ
jgi:hypothetical protein